VAVGWVAVSVSVASMTQLAGKLLVARPDIFGTLITLIQAAVTFLAGSKLLTTIERTRGKLVVKLLGGLGLLALVLILYSHQKDLSTHYYINGKNASLAKAGEDAEPDSTKAGLVYQWMDGHFRGLGMLVAWVGGADGSSELCLDQPCDATGRRLDKAVQDLQRAVSLDPRNAAAMYELGFAYAQQFEYDKSIAAYKLAFSLDPNYSAPLMNLAHTAVRRGDFVSAIEALGTMKPPVDSASLDYYLCWLHLGWSNLGLKNYVAAENDLREAIGALEGRNEGTNDGTGAFCLLGQALEAQADRGSEAPTDVSPSRRPRLPDDARDAYARCVALSGAGVWARGPEKDAYEGPQIAWTERAKDRLGRT
jgi:tetratricopeptide (TPR) repeat protein